MIDDGTGLTSPESRNKVCCVWSPRQGGIPVLGAPAAATSEQPASSCASTMEPLQLGVTVRRRDIILAPGMEFPVTRNWPATPTFVKLEKLSIRLQVDVSWPAQGHLESLVLCLSPQAGARLAVGGPKQDAEKWLPLMLMGEQSLTIQSHGPPEPAPEQVEAPRANVLRATCRYQWDEEPTEDDADGVGTSTQKADKSASGLPSAKGLMDSAVCLVGFALRARMDVTATLYVSPVVPGSGNAPKHTLLVSGSGTLEVRPRLVELRFLGLPQLLAAAQEDSKKGDLVGALQKWRHALPMQERNARLGGSKAAAQLASLLHSMGTAYTAHADSRQALSCLRRALTIWSHIYGEEHAESAKTLSALGVVRVRDGEFHEAFEYFWQALKYYEAYEPDSLDASNTLQQIAGVYGKLGEMSEALECYSRAQTIRERELGSDHPEVASTLHNLGVVLEKLSDHGEALDSLHRALMIRERRLGPTHPQTARTLHSIGIVYSQMLDYTSALTFYQRALTICSRRSAEDMHAAATLNNMGVVYAKLGHMQLALQHHKQALELQERVLGESHCDTVATRHNLMVLQAEMEQEKQLGVLDHLKSFFSAAFSPEEPARPSLLGLLCYERHDPEGPVDEAPCSRVVGCPGSCSMSRQRWTPHQGALLNDAPAMAAASSSRRSPGAINPAALHSAASGLGVPQPRRKSMPSYPSAFDMSAPGAASGSVTLRQPGGERRDGHPMAPSDADMFSFAPRQRRATTEFGFSGSSLSKLSL
eukprot:TRINITY_DN91764_c0_g1_i1.p1 TRINITY_DN91764_c0_g1~~TRINITY_DN91764_c0_g1_i1.p1  ORF type:complete len:761 (+),score=99.91 TRINITY_DN91764_c0_g1_i1:100-2382(+)